MCNRKFGIELEFQSEYQDNICTTVSNKARELNLECSNNETPDKWTIKYDCSCGPEITSPAYEFNQENISNVREIVKSINELGNNLVNRQCGFHVHIEIEDFNRIQRKKLIALYKKVEPIIIKSIPPSRRNNQFVIQLGSNNDDFDSRYFLANYNNHYIAVNFYKYESQGTYEVRYAAGTSNYTKIINWITFLLILTETAKLIRDYNDIPNFETPQQICEFVQICRHEFEHQQKRFRLAIQWFCERYEHFQNPTPTQTENAA